MNTTHKRLLSLLVFLAVTHSAIAQGCSATAWAVERAGSWEEGGFTRRVFDLQITNTGSCTITDWVSVFLNVPQGNKIVKSWGFSTGDGSVVGFSKLLAGQTFSGAGFVWAGHDNPNPSVSGYGGCSCSDGQTTGPSSTTGAASTTGSPSPWINVPNYKLGLRILLLGCTVNDTEIVPAETVFQSTGTPYDKFLRSDVGTNLVSFYDANNMGKYYAVVTSYPLEGPQTCWTTDQANAIYKYIDDHHIKMVILYSIPQTVNGVSSTKGLTKSVGIMTFAPAMLNWSTHAQPNAPLQVPVGVIQYPAAITTPARAVPAFYVSNLTGDSAQYVIAAFITLPNGPNGRKILEFYLESAFWVSFVPIVGHSWLNWVTNGIWLGLRRIEINIQVDDIYMNTGMFDNVTKEESNKTSDFYRITPSDLTWISNWQTNLNNRLPAGSHFVLTFPFNGETIGQKGGYTGDQLYLRSKELRDHFFWESHTFRHPYLDNLTYDEVTEELTLNRATFNQLFDNNLNRDNVCTRSMVTPSISGLYNGEALRALYDFGYVAVVGDNTHDDLLPDFPYHGWYTTVVPNGFAGVYVVPRFATEIYYDASLPEHIENLYNFVHKYDYFTALHFNEIVALDTGNAVNHLLNYRQDPYMMHQANMRVFTYNGQSTTLLSYWTDQLINQLIQYSALPVLSHTHDELAARLQAREARDNCGFDGYLVIDPNNYKVLGFHASSTSNCEYAITGAMATPSSTIENEVVGPEKTLWLTMTASPFGVDVPITNAVSMNM